MVKDVNSFNQYLRPTYLCDFDRMPEIVNTALSLTKNLADKRQMFNCIYKFIEEFPYGLEDWDVKASETLRKGWGMCSGKTNLLVAMSRSVGIPARYRISKVPVNDALWRWVVSQERELALEVNQLLSQRDHVTADAYLNGWEAYDPSQDFCFEEGLRRLGIPMEPEIVTRTSHSRPIILASIDKWAQNRQEARRFKKDREQIFCKVNKQLDRIRAIGMR